MRISSLFLLSLLVASTAVLTSTARAEELRVAGRLSHEPLGEVSGIVRGSRINQFWVHNDSGDDARIFTVNSTGDVLLPGYLRSRHQDTPWPGLAVLNAWNVDWEDITRSPEGLLYLADTGNNGNARRDLGIYVLPEPNPLSVDRARAFTFLPIRYPDQREYPARLWHFDCEAVFHADGRLYFLTKHRKPGQISGWQPGAKLYRLDTSHTDEENVLTLVGEHPQLTLATGADLSMDGQHLAVATYLGVWLFGRPEAGDNWLDGPSRFIELPREQLQTSEAVTWMDAQTLLVVNEERTIYELAISSLP